jgi:hypothetical protein
MRGLRFLFFSLSTFDVEDILQEGAEDHIFFFGLSLSDIFCYIFCFAERVGFNFFLLFCAMISLCIEITTLFLYGPGLASCWAGLDNFYLLAYVCWLRRMGEG